METITTKRCVHCGRELPASEFYSAPKNKDGLASWCKSCYADERKKQRRSMKARLAILEQRGGLESYTPRELMLELKRRGYEGSLCFTERKCINLAEIE